MKPLEYEQASGAILWLLKRVKKHAIVMPWGICYTRYVLPLWPEIRAHEEEHWKQFNKHGKIKFVFLYLYELLNKGYWDNKYEVEARVAESKIKR